jgi:aryl carrier-like protein
VLFLTTALFNQMAREAPTGFAGLRHLLFGGQAVEPRWVAQVLRHGYRGRLLHVYGPTEATTYSTWHEIREVAGTESTIPIGKPIANTEAYLLDGRLGPVPVGVTGELYIGGDALARDYLNRPALTAERFIPDPFSRRAGRRLYMTGDLARYRTDGEIEFMGRIDNQIKLRGFRVEVEEVAVILGAHPGISEAVVVAREDEPGEKRLVAYVVSAQGHAPSNGELRSYLKEKLPEYMVPSTFVALEKLPLTSNGKVDRRALPAPDRTRSETESYVAPRTSIEETLAHIWSEVLRVEQVGVDDNFFELGGDSILSIQVISRARKAGLLLSPRQLFERPTIAQLAAVVGSATAVEAVEQGPVTGEVLLTPIQRWFFEQQLADPHHFNQAVVLDAPSALNPDLLEQAVSHLLAHHDALRLRFQRTAAGWRQFNAPTEAHRVFSTLDLSSVAEAQRPQAMTEAATALQASLDLKQGPLVRLLYIDLGAGRAGRLFWVIHHLAVETYMPSTSSWRAGASSL